MTLTDAQPAPQVRIPLTAGLPGSAATVRTMILCVPDRLELNEVVTGSPAGHPGVRDVLLPRFRVHGKPSRRHRRHLADLHPGRPAFCAGGPLRLLDLAGMQQDAAAAAGWRHRLWLQAVRGTRPAQSWPVLLRKHLAKPARYSYRQAVADFWAQPRISAMRLHNTTAAAAWSLPIEHIEALQAGPAAYQNFCSASALCGDALLTAHGTWLVPTSDDLSDRVTYLHVAAAHLSGLSAHARLLAIGRQQA